MYTVDTDNNMDSADTSPQAHGAQDFATAAHADQAYGMFPYECHLNDVARVVQEIGFVGEEYQIVACLHDTLEDTDVSPEQIGARFGATTLRAVRQLTRKEGSLSTGYFDDMDALALAVKLGDRIADLRVIGIAAYGSVERYGKLLSNYQDEMPGLLRKALPLAGSFQQAVDVLHRELVLAHQRLATASTAKRIPPVSETLPQ